MLIENDEKFWVDLRNISERLGWELGQTLKTCFALGWDLLSQRITPKEKERVNDKEELE